MSTPRILITEDEPNLREVLRLQLEHAGYQVLEACDGLQALDVAQREIPDLVLLDVMMPELDGYETCRRLRGQFATRNIPIIMLPAKSRYDDKVQGGRRQRLRDEAVARARVDAARAQRARLEPAATLGEPADGTAGQRLDR